jgi:glycosyltransferase involved in cell wall biosynthesis
LKIAILNTFAFGGGAARAAYRLHKSLMQNPSITSSYYITTDYENGEDIIKSNIINFDSATVDGDIQGNYIDTNRTNISNTFFSATIVDYDIVEVLKRLSVDIINLHWVARFISSKTLKEIGDLGIPIVWTLHDERPLTGGCHYSSGCDGYIQTYCHTCPQLASDPMNLPYKTLCESIELIKSLQITTVSPSYWLRDGANKSLIFQNKSNVTIKNSIETDVYIQHKREDVRPNFGIPLDAFTILCGAQDNKEKRKGFFLFAESIKIILQDKHFADLAQTEKLYILSIGHGGEELTNIGIPVIDLGFINDDIKLAQAYSASDLFVLPSLEDNLPNTILESMACGIPVIGFSVGGIPDLVIHGETGLLAKLGSSLQLALNIKLLIKNRSLLEKMGTQSRKLIVDECSLKKQAKNYVFLYQNLIAR